MNSIFNPIFLVYVLVFLVSALACFLAAFRTLKIEETDTRQGLFYLLVFSGAWALSHVGFFVLPLNSLKTISYVFGLIVGLMTVGAWLYFCSAYTNRVLHRHKGLRRTAIGVFLVLIFIKVTNPIHHVYFTTEFVASPFPHLAVNNGIIHWLSMGLSYALFFVGFFMLLELFIQVSYNTKPLLFLTGITGTPLLFDLIGFSSPYLVDITYEPIGVAIFGVGVFYLFFESFQAIQVAGRQKDPVIVLDADERIREYNDGVKEIFPVFNSTKVVGKKLQDVLPNVSEILRSNENIINKKIEGKEKYFQVTKNQFSAGEKQLGKALILTDVTKEKEAEEREKFLHSLLRHDVQNKNQIILGYLELLNEQEMQDDVREKINKALKAVKESEEIIEKVRTLREIEEEEIGKIRVDKVVKETIEENKGRARENGFKLITECKEITQKVKAGPLIKEVFNNLLGNAIKHSGGKKIKINCKERDGEVIYSIEDDGKGIPEEIRAKVFEKGYKSGENAGTGLGLYLVKEITESYGGKVKILDSELGGTRIDIYLKKS